MKIYTSNYIMFHDLFGDNKEESQELLEWIGQDIMWGDALHSLFETYMILHQIEQFVEHYPETLTPVMLEVIEKIKSLPKETLISL